MDTCSRGSCPQLFCRRLNMKNPLLATDPWADWAAQDQEHYEPPSYAILHHPGPFPWLPPDDVPLDQMSRADLVAYSTSSSVSTPVSTLSSPSPYFLTIDSFKSRGGHTAAIHHGTFAMEGETPLRVVLKTYAIEDISRLIHEFDVYAAIAREAGIGEKVARHLAVIVPTLHAVVKPRYDPWGGLILENAGTVLSEYEIRWDDLGLTHQEKILLYNTLRQLHSAGVVHGDVAPRNILRRPCGAFCLVDFDRSTLNHVCPGATCKELSEFQRVLRLQLSDLDV
ncbi:hypothetical protein B0H13DRAFT_2005592 [Mycena leptocephala]|nr:hypothetical protein B0H13DRAFT_2005592 [Mycena leptocephala]